MAANLARIIRQTSLRSGRNSVVSNVLPANTFSVRFFAAPQYKDIPNDVSEDSAQDPALIKIPFMRDEVRQEMFKKYMSDRNTWSIENLAKQYGTSLIRTQAIVLLMQRRHDMISNDEQRLKGLLDESVASDMESSKGKEVQDLKIQPVLNVPPELEKLYAKHQEDKTVSLELLISSYNDNLSESGDEAKRLVLGEKELKEAFQIITKHARRQENLLANFEDLEEDIEEAREADVDVSTFRESPSSYRTNKAYNYSNKKDRHVRRSFTENYYPNMANDEVAKREELVLLQRIEKETKAQLEHDMDYYERVYSIQTPTERVEEARTAPLPEALQYHSSPRAEAPMSRFKLAFQDLSQCSVPQTKTSVRVPARSVIRTRKGE